MSLVKRREHDHAERCGDEHADAKRPQQFGAENSPLVNFGGSVSVMALAHRAARKEDQQIDRQIAKHQQRDGGAGQNAGAERHGAHGLRERRLINLVIFSQKLGMRKSIGR